MKLVSLPATLLLLVLCVDGEVEGGASVGLAGQRRTYRRCQLTPPPGCVCRNRYRPIVTCSGQGMRSFPNQYTGNPHLYMLDVSGNMFTHLQRSDFTGYTMQKLRIADNKSPTIESKLSFDNDTFTNVQNTLTYVDMSRSKLREFPEILWNLVNLEVLILEGCRIESIRNSDVASLSNLRDLRLRDNFLLVFIGDVLAPLQLSTLYLTTNQGRCGRSNCMSLSNFTAQDQNKFMYINNLAIESTAINNLASFVSKLMQIRHLELSEVVLHGYNWPNWVDLPTELVSLALPNCQGLYFLPCGRFFGHTLRFLEYLDLHGNALRFMHTTCFRNGWADNLKYLNVNNNKIHTLETGLLDALPSLQSLDISRNRINQLGEAHFPSSYRFANMNIFIGDNPFICHGSAFTWLKARLRYQVQGSPGPFDMYEIMHKIKCREPANVSGHLLYMS